jgi:hypothetical protein
VTQIGVFPPLMYITVVVSYNVSHILKMFSLMNKTFASDTFIFS